MYAPGDSEMHLIIYEYLFYLGIRIFPGDCLIYLLLISNQRWLI